MLFYKTIDASTLGLLKKLLGIELFKDLSLAGGTSLALQIGHRKSIDLYFFGKLNVDDTAFTEALAPFKKITLLKKTPNISIFTIDGIKVDFVNYSYPWIEKIKTEDGIRLAGLKDISAMKMAAVTGRGTKKDFIDIYFLLQHFSLKEMLANYKKKYADGSEFLVLKSMTFFEDAEQELEPIMIKNIVWNDVKKTILEKHNEYLKSL